MSDLRSVNIAEILDSSISLIKENLKSFIIIGLYIFIPAYLLFNIPASLLNPQTTFSGAFKHIFSVMENPELAQMPKDQMHLFFIGQILAGLYGLLNIVFVLPVTSGAVCRMVMCHFEKIKTTPKECIKWALGKFGYIFGTMFLKGLILSLILFVCMIPIIISFAALGVLGGSIGKIIGIVIIVLLSITAMIIYLYMLIRYALSHAVVIAEDTYFIKAMSRSSALVKGNMWKVIAIFLIVGVINLFIMTIPAFIPLPVISVIITCAAILMYQIFFYACLMNTYIACRSSHENFDIHNLTEQAFAEADDDNDEPEYSLAEDSQEETGYEKPTDA